MKSLLTAAAIALAVFTAACANDLQNADELLATGDFEGAAAIYQKRLDKNESDGTGLIGMANVRYTEALYHAKEGKDTLDEWARAVEYLEKAVVIDPAPKGVKPVAQDMFADALLRLGMKRFEAKDWKGCAEALSKAVDNGLKKPELFVMLARAEAEAANFDAALKAAHRASKMGACSAEFLREAAGWATKHERPWMHHLFFYRAEKVKPLGLKFRRPVDITKALTKKYGALNMINDALSLFLFNEEIEPRAWSGILEQEALIKDMEKFISKKPPKAFAKEDKKRLHWVVYHYWNTTGVVFAYLGDGGRAKKWFRKAGEIDAKKIRHPDLNEKKLEDEKSWVQNNMVLIE